jgi:hypothetical protein
MMEAADEVADGDSRTAEERQAVDGRLEPRWRRRKKRF